MILRRILLVFITALFLSGSPCRAAEESNAFFAMNTIARGKPEVVVPLLKELGYAGLGGAAGDAAMPDALQRAGLRFFNAYTSVSFDSAEPVGVSASLQRQVEILRGFRSALWITIPKVVVDGAPVAKSSPAGDAVVVAQLRALAEFAEPLGVKIALYPHAGTWLERVEDATRVADQVNHPAAGVTFNLCHWLKVEGSERDPLPVLQAAAPRLMFVTINGADTGDTRTMGWDRLIQPLGSGSYDVAAFLAKVRAAGFSGPIGFQGFGIKEEPRAVLQRSIEAWRSFQPGR